MASAYSVKKAKQWSRDILRRHRQAKQERLRKEDNSHQVPQWVRDLAERDFQERLKGIKKRQ
jgi:hypothetical protein